MLRLKEMEWKRYNLSIADFYSATDKYLRLCFSLTHAWDREVAASSILDDLLTYTSSGVTCKVMFHNISPSTPKLLIQNSALSLTLVYGTACFSFSFLPKWLPLCWPSVMAFDFIQPSAFHPRLRCLIQKYLLI